MSLFAGIDIGSVATKLVLFECSNNGDRNIVYSQVVPSFYDPEETANKMLKRAIEATGENPVKILATGYGRHAVHFSTNKATEITCHSKGIFSLYPGRSTVIDIGGQDSKAISVSENGKVIDFVMNDKCAAGTGRFLEVMARALDVELPDLNNLALKAKNNIRISSVCTVFAESEVISLISKKTPKEEIASGIIGAITSRVASMASRLRIAEPIFMTGGVCQASSVISSMEQALGYKINIPETPQLIGALGAAIIASEDRH
jgi:(R)-2-hydroxyacyl-CoA dehydratese activating ATPase